MTEIELPGGYFIEVHRGFYQAYLSVGDEVQKLIEEQSDGISKRLIFTGHSLGGALAILASLKCRILNLPHKVITFGCPRVGSRALASYMRHTVVRIEAAGDQVPHTPWPWVPWRPSCLYCHAGKVIKRGTYFPGLTKPHSMLRYHELAKELQEELSILL
jgi:predicted lipase